MQTRYYLLLLSLVSLILSGCSKEENGDPVIAPEAEIVLDKEAIDMQVKEKTTVRISDGNGDYNAFSLNEGIAAVTLNNNDLEIEGKAIGVTYVIVADKNTRLKLLPVTIYQHDKIVLETASLELKFKLGNPLQGRVEVLEGNGKYTAVSENESIATAHVAENTIIVTAQGVEGTANIVVTDACNRQTTLSVNALSTTVPYNEDELSVIMNQTFAPYFVLNETASGNYYTFINRQEDNMNISGYDYAGFYTLMIYYPGDKSVGEKSGGRISYRNIPYGSSSGGTLDLDYFKIIKNDGTKIWAVFSVIKEGVLKWGYFIQDIE